MLEFRRIIALIAALACVSFAQETHREVTQALGAADAKPNDPKVPDVVSIPSQFERRVILRFKHQTELLSTLERAIQENKIQNGVILNAFGSVHPNQPQWGRR